MNADDGRRDDRGSRRSGGRRDGGGDRRRPDSRRSGGGDRRSGGRRRDSRGGGDRRRSGGGDRRSGDRRRDDRRGSGRGDRGGGDRHLRDDNVDLVPQYETARRQLGPDGKPLPREIVVPGQDLTEGDVRPGLGTYSTDGTVVSATLGIKNVDNRYASVIPLSGMYIPRPGDVVIGRIVDVGPSNWLIEINSPYPAPMHVNEVPWHVEFGETTNFLKAGDTVIVKVTRITEVGRVQVTMDGPGLRKLQGGQVVSIEHSKVPRVIGTKGSMINLIKKYTACRIVVGQNGRIWIDGEPDDILIVMGAIRMIEEGAHLHGLTNKVREHLQRAKGIDPEVEAREEAERERAEKAERERAEKAERERAEKAERERAERKGPKEEGPKTEGPRSEEDKPRGSKPDSRKPRDSKPDSRKPKGSRSKGRRRQEMEDEAEDDIDEDELCVDKDASGGGIVTILSPDGESLMVVDDEDLPECKTDKEG